MSSRGPRRPAGRPRLTVRRASAKLVPDAHMAALAIERGAEVISTDTDFARITEVRWRNPLA